MESLSSSHDGAWGSVALLVPLPAVAVPFAASLSGSSISAVAVPFPTSGSDISAVAVPLPTVVEGG